jgi:mitochondrial import receptor subunit TOM40
VRAAETLATNFIFDGARADLTKVLSVEPAFQLTHSFQLASQQLPQSYNLSTVFATQNVRAPDPPRSLACCDVSLTRSRTQVFLQGNVDNEGNVNMRVNQGWTPSSTSKLQGQVRTSKAVLCACC